jgi:glycosyltransferase involved in cell wall biosynthesis
LTGRKTIGEQEEDVNMGLVSIILPAYHEEKVIGQVVTSIHDVMKNTTLDYEIVVVDDGSTDHTSEMAHAAGARVIRHAYNLGNGAAVKTGIRHAHGDVVVLMDADGQHNPNDIPRLLAEIPTHGMVVGARTRDSDTALYRDLANFIYNTFASYICGTKIEDLTSGFRAIRTPLARQFLYLLPNTFSYPTTITLSVLRAGHCVKYVPIKTARRVGKSKIKPLQDGPRFLVIMLKIATLFSPLKVFLPVSLLVFGLGVLWYIYTNIFIGQRIPPATIILIISSILFFLMGLISEQIAQLRYERSEYANGISIDYEFIESAIEVPLQSQTGPEGIREEGTPVSEVDI